MTKTIKILASLMLAVMLLGTAGCETLDDDRMVGACHIDLSNTGYWTVYGVHSAGAYRIFNKDKRQPSNFPFTASTYTGNAGVLLVGTAASGDVVPMAFEMACPYCRKHTVVLGMNASTLQAECPTCASCFDVLIGGGQPVSGPALNKHYAMHRYSVAATSSGGYIIGN